MGSKTRMKVTSLVVAPAALALSAFVPLRAVDAQALMRTVDEGTFLISRGGAPIGRESFRISLSEASTGDAYRATAQVALGDRRIVPTLICDSAGSPVSYDVAVQGGGDQGTRLTARARPGRFTSLLRTRDGESTHEYFVPRGVVVLDDDVIHQLYFVTLRGRRSGSLTLLAPRTGTQAVANLENQGASSVEIAGNSIPATHFVLSAAGFARREFWIDAAGRVLRAAIPERNLVAQRDELPR
jgi:hypothetical protein